MSISYKTRVYGVPALAGLALALLVAAPLNTRAGKIKYTYDTAGRLVGADYGDGKTATFAYDRNGNLLNHTTGVATNADVRLSKSANVAAITAGVPFNYTLTVTNPGPTAALGVQVTDTLPFGIFFSGVNPSQGTAVFSNNTVVGNLGLVGPNSGANITITVFHGITNSATNVAIVTAATPDPILANNTATAAPTRGFPPSDSDSDGMPNWWESLYGLSPFLASGVHGANGDPDGDGVRNLHEFLAGTNPMDRNSLLRIDEIQHRFTDVRLLFKSSAMRRYNAQFTDALGATSFATFQTMDGNGGLLSVTDTNLTSSRFYRLEAVVP